MRVAPPGRIRRQTEVLYRARPIGCLLEGFRDLGSHFILMSSEQRLEPLPDAQAESCPSSRRLSAVEYLPIQGVHKLIALGERSVGEPERSRPAQHALATRKRIADFIKLLLVQSRGDSDHARPKRYTLNASYLQ